MRALRAAGVVAAIAAFAAGTSACADGGGDAGAARTPTPGLSWQPRAGDTGLVSATATPSAAPANTSDPWQFDLADPHDPNVPSSQWPDVEKVISKGQVKAAFPDARSVTASGALKLHYNGDAAQPGPATAKNTQVTWKVAMKSSGGPATVTVDLKAVGADKPLTKAWEKQRDAKKSSSLPTDTFYQRGTFGTKGLYLLQNNRASVLISDGDMAAWIDLSFGAFYGLAANPSDATEVLKTQVFPVIVRDIASHMPRRYA